MDKKVFAMLYGKLKSIATGVKSIAINPIDSSKIDFTLNDNSKISLQIPNSNVFVDKYSLLPATGKTDVINIVKNDENNNKKGIYIWNSSSSKYVPLYEEKGIEILEDYSKLPVSTEYSIKYCINDYIDTSVTPNKKYPKGFYLYDKILNAWIETNTSISNEFKFELWTPSAAHLKDKYYVYDYKLYKCVNSDTDSTFNNDNYELIIGNKNFEITFTDKKDIPVQHNLNCKAPMVKIFDDNNAEIELDIEYYSDNLLILHSEIDVSGKVIVTKI